METMSVPRAIPKCRRRYNTFGSLSSSPMTIGGVSGSCPAERGIIMQESESVKGNAYLCFWEDGSRFEGHLTTDNESHYSLVGRCPEILDLTSSQEEEVVVEEEIGQQFSRNYNVTLVDHDDEETFNFQRVSLLKCEQLPKLLSPHLSFKADNIYKGQKADMLIQRYLTPRLVGQNLKVYAGPLTVDLNRPNSQPNSWKSSPLWYL